MVSAWWLLVAFWIGGVLGLVLGALLAKTGHTQDKTQTEGETPERRARRAGGRDLPLF